MNASITRDGPHQAITRREALIRGAALGLGVAAVTGSRAIAQEATPAACPDAVLIGDTISFVSVEGVEIGTLTIDEMVDPFTGYSPSYPPPRGNRFLLLTLTCKNTGVNPWGIDSGRIFLQDVEGFVIYPSGVDLGPEPAVPPFGYQEIPPGGEVTGVQGYVLLKGVAPRRIFFSPSSDRLLLLAELPGEG